MDNIFTALLKAEQAASTTSELEGRSFGVSLAVVADVSDPLSLGRIRVLLPSKGTKTLSDWLTRLTPSKYVSVPLVEPGDTVAVAFVNGNPSQGVYLGCINNVPQPPAKEVATTVSVNGDTSIVQAADKVTITAGQATLVLTKEGNLDISNVSSVTINGKQVATVNAKDTRNDTLVTRGW